MGTKIGWTGNLTDPFYLLVRALKALADVVWTISFGVLFMEKTGTMFRLNSSEVDQIHVCQNGTLTERDTNQAVQFWGR